MKENIVVLYEMINCHSISIQLIRTLMSHVVPHLLPNEHLGLPSDTRDSPSSCE